MQKECSANDDYDPPEVHRTRPLPAGSCHLKIRGFYSWIDTDAGRCVDRVTSVELFMFRRLPKIDRRQSFMARISRNQRMKWTLMERARMQEVMTGMITV